MNHFLPCHTQEHLPVFPATTRNSLRRRSGTGTPALTHAPTQRVRRTVSLNFKPRFSIFPDKCAVTVFPGRANFLLARKKDQLKLWKKKKKVRILPLNYVLKMSLPGCNEQQNCTKLQPNSIHHYHGNYHAHFDVFQTRSHSGFWHKSHPWPFRLPEPRAGAFLHNSNHTETGSRPKGWFCRRMNELMLLHNTSPHCSQPCPSR